MAKYSASLNSNFSLALALGLINGCSNVSTLGRVTLTSPNVVMDLTNLGVDVIPLPADNGEALEIVSTSSLDTDIQVLIMTLGPDGVDVDSVPGLPQNSVLMQLDSSDGTTPVPFPTNLSRVTNGFVISLKSSVGDIRIQQVGGGTVFLLIEQFLQSSNHSLISLSLTNVFKIAAISGSLEKVGGADTAVLIIAQLKFFGASMWTRGFEFGLQRNGTSTFNYKVEHPQVFTGPADFKISASTESTQNPVASSRAEGLFCQTSTVIV